MIQPEPPSGTARRVAVARGDAPPDLVLKGGRVLSVFTGELLERPLELGASRLTIRAAVGHKPVIVFRPELKGSAESDKQMIRLKCGSSGKITIGSDQANDHGTQDATGKTTFAIESHNDSSGYYFNPTILQGSAGQSITLNIKNDGSVPHNFSITSMNVNITLQPGASQEVKVTFPQTGTVEYFCSFHHALGMAGELSVA